jgi:TUG ubiquitin-like domain
MTGALPVRVTVEDVWDEVLLELTPETPIGEIKRQALARTRVKGDPAQYVLKYRGAELSDESETVASSGLVPNSALIVMARRRRPVR